MRFKKRNVINGSWVNGSFQFDCNFMGQRIFYTGWGLRYDNTVFQGRLIKNLSKHLKLEDYEFHTFILPHSEFFICDMLLGVVKPRSNYMQVYEVTI